MTKRAAFLVLATVVLSFDACQSLTMEKRESVSVDFLLERTRKLMSDNISPNDKVFVAVAGGPGTGKSTLASRVCEGLNKGGNEIAAVVPMDGYHIPRKDLRAMAEKVGSTESYEELMRRRGDPDTFLPAKLAADLKTLKDEGQGVFPTYDRSISDPVSDGVTVNQEHKIIICEGLYVLSLDDKEWEPLAGLWNDRWFLDVPENVVRERLVKRHLRNWSEEKEATWGPGKAGAEKKTDEADLKRTGFIAMNSRQHCDLRFSFFTS